MKNNNGFVIVGVMALGALITMGFFASLAYKKIIDNETQLLNVRHTGYIIEDSLRTRIAILAYNAPSGTTATAARQNVITKLKQSVRSHNATTYVKSSIPNSICSDTGIPCNVYLSDIKFVNNACNLMTTKSENCPAVSEASATKAILTIKAETFKRNTAGVGTIQERGAGTKELEIPIPTATEITRKVTITSGSLLCPVLTPIFKGTELVNVRNNRELRAKCESIPTRANSSLSCALPTSTGGCNLRMVECSKNEGFWLTGVNQDLSPKCERFPAGTGVSNPVLNLCSSGQVAVGFNLNSKFEATNVVCRDKGAPYDFQP